MCFAGRGTVPLAESHSDSDPLTISRRVADSFTSPDSGLMNGVQTMRNRYFWHSAEFARTVSGIPLLVKLGLNYTKFEVPPHETVAPETATTVPRRSYVYWPIQDKVDDTAGSRSQFMISPWSA